MSSTDLFDIVCIRSKNSVYTAEKRITILETYKELRMQTCSWRSLYLMKNGTIKRIYGTDFELFRNFCSGHHSGRLQSMYCSILSFFSNIETWNFSAITGSSIYSNNLASTAAELNSGSAVEVLRRGHRNWYWLLRRRSTVHFLQIYLFIACVQNLHRNIEDERKDLIFDANVFEMVQSSLMGFSITTCIFWESY